MKIMMTGIAGLVFAAVIVAASGGARGETIVIVRHADRDRAKADQPLLPAGENRARELGRLLHHDQIDHIFYTRDEREKPRDWVRVCQTAQGIYAGLDGAADTAGAASTAARGTDGVDNAKAKPEPIPRFYSDGAALLQWLTGADGKVHPHVDPADHVDVVVLHHEEIPDLLDRLTSPDDPAQGPHVQISPDDYDNIFILTRGQGEKKFAMLRLSFTPPPATQPVATQPAGGCEAAAAPGGAGAGEKAEKAEGGENGEKKGAGR